MKTTYLPRLITAALACALVIPCADAQQKTPGFNQKIPEKIMTPDKVEAPFGTLNFVDGVPTAETTRRLYDNLDYIRGMEVFLNFIPATSMEGLRRGQAELGAKKSNEAVIFDQLLDSNPLFLTGNTDTVYCMVFLDLQVDGPTVVEIPPGTGPGTVDDAFFRFVIDMGAPGPDRGKGGKYLIVPPGYKGTMPKDKKDGGEYFVAQSTSYVNWIALRGFLKDGKPDAATKMFKEGLRVYPLSKAANPPKMKFVSGSKLAFNTVHANTLEFFEELDHVIQKEPIDFLDPELRGQLASIGIVKGKKFAPDERMKKILISAVAVGNATARAISFRDREKRATIYPNSQWQSLSAVTDYRWLDKDAEGARNLDARTKFFYGYTVNTPAMMAKLVGRGSQYAIVFADASGERGQELSHPSARECPREGLLVDGGLRPADAFRAANLAALSRSEQHQEQVHQKLRRLGRSLLRPPGAPGQRGQLDRNRAAEGLVRNLPSLRPSGAVVRQDLAPG
jgi:hypothetical protein